MSADESLYTILLTAEEVEYLCDALERELERIPNADDVRLWLLQQDEMTMQAIVNGHGYDLVSHLHFGGPNEKLWARVEN
jgi:hypothetical protein